MKCTSRLKRSSLATATGHFRRWASAALAGEAVPRNQIGASQTRPGTVNAAIVSYYETCTKFGLMASGTQRLRRNVLERFRLEHGDKRIALLGRDHIEKMVAAKGRDTGCGADVPEVPSRADAALRQGQDDRGGPDGGRREHQAQVGGHPYLGRGRDRRLRGAPSDRDTGAPRPRLAPLHGTAAR